MGSGEADDSGHHKIHCDRCGKAMMDGEAYQHDSKRLCEDCLMQIRSPRARKTHWQYIGSIKNEYLIPGKKVRR
jgi:hypothetical protein